MTRNNILMIVLALFAGAAAGLGAQSLRSDPAPEPPAQDEIAMLRAEIDSLRDRLADRDREIDLGLKDSVARIERLQEDVEAAVARAEESPPDPADPASPHRVEISQSGVPRGRIIAGGPGGAGMISLGKPGKALELMKLPEEERWAKLREELSLDAYQESELKAIRDDLLKEMQDMIKFDPATGKMEGKLDVAKMMKSRQDADERVKNLLSREQYRKFSEEGYGAAVGLGTTTVAVSYSSASEPKEREGK